jgi:ectoine hydroxylase-related dioxygenase (phytanoyl-CoA dioxygenase family)
MVKKAVAEVEDLNIVHLRDIYVENGFVAIKNFFTREQCDSLLSLLDSYRSNYDERLNAGEFKGVISDNNYSKNNKRVVYWYNFTDTYNEVNTFVKNKKLHSIAENLISAPAKNVVYWIKQVEGDYIDRSDVLTNEKYHSDSVGLNAVRALVYLNDIDSEEKGPFYYVKHSHLKKPLSLRPFTLSKEEMCNRKGIPLFAEKGDVIFADVNGYHKAGRPKNGLRSTLQILFVSETADYFNRLFNYTTYAKEAKNESAISK